jgi:hypothetical protein
VPDTTPTQPTQTLATGQPLAASRPRLAARIATEPDSRSSDSDVVHIVGNLQHFLGRLGIKVPRSLCGVLLIGDPDTPDPADLGARTCPKCAGIAGWDAV